MRHQWNANWVAELPIGNGKPILPDMGTAGQAVFGGWQLSGPDALDVRGFPSLC